MTDQHGRAGYHCSDTIDIEEHIAANDLTTRRRALWRNGYRPVPISGPGMNVHSAGKRPLMKNWRAVCANADDAEIDRWTEAEPNCTNTGLLCGELIGIDVDVLAPDLVEKIVAMALVLLGPTPLIRTGKAPKTLLCYRATTPFTKLETPELFFANGDKAQIEILAQGQQFVAFGIHPDTGRAYEWRQDGPDIVPLADLPVVTENACRAFLAAAEGILRADGGRTKAEIEGEARAAASASKTPKPGENSFFPEVNRAALGAIGDWLLKIFPTARQEPGTGAWRVRSADLGRPLEEDLSMHPTEGGYDFGTGKSCSPIDVVMEWGKAADAVQAAHWLCDQLGIDPATLGWKDKARKDEQPADGVGNADNTQRQPPPIDGLLLSLDDWLAAEIAPPDFLMGEVFHTESRAYLIGPTGLGKTNFSMALAAAMAAGTDFLHWKGSGKCRKVLYVDGEMGQRLMSQRIQDVVRRHGSKPDGLFVLCRANAGEMPPLNTEKGQQFIEAVIERIGGVDFIVFDNLQALVTGSLREEDSFAAVLTWAKILTSQTVGQIWVHHTGLDESRGYGDKSKEWQFDTVLLLKRAGEDGEVVFDLEFTKARERTPDNRTDYAPVRVALVNDQWEGAAGGQSPFHHRKPPSPKAQAFYGALTDALCVSLTISVTTKTAWRAECQRKGLMHVDPDGDGKRYTKSSISMFNQYATELVSAGWIGINGEEVRSLQK